MEQLAARFELVIEAVSGFDGRLETMRRELTAQFAEVGRQLAIVCQQIAENKEAIQAVRNDLSAELIRVNELVGQTRVSLGQELSAQRTEIENSIAAALAASRAETVPAVASRKGKRAESRPLPSLSSPAAGAKPDAAGHEPAAALDVAAMLKQEIAEIHQQVVKHIQPEIKRTSTALTNLGKKFERFDDRLTVQVRDHEQRLRKLERAGR